MATHTATALDLSTDDPQAESRNYWTVLEGWWETDRRDQLTPIAQLTFGALIHMANRRWFPTVMDIDKKELERFVGHSRESVRRALTQLSNAGLIHLSTTQGRGRALVRMCYEEFEATRSPRRVVRAQSERSRVIRAQIVREDIVDESPKPQSSYGIPSDSPPTQVQAPEKLQNCPERTTSVSEVGEELREGNPCPKCHRNDLVVKFRTNSAAQTKERFLACSGFASGDCRGFTWNLSSSPYQPSLRVRSQASSGARHVPGRPPLVSDLLTAKRVEEASETVETCCPAGLAEWFSGSRYLPEELMLDTLSEAAPDLAIRHRDLGSAKAAILRDVKARIAAEDGSSELEG